MNRLPSQMKFQCFLLDRDNKVLLTGNPILSSPMVWKLYRQHISGEIKPEQKKVRTTVLGEKPVQDVWTMKNKEMYARTYVVKNTGDSPVVIMDVDMSFISCTDSLREKRPPCVRREGFDQGRSAVDRRSVQEIGYGIWERGECLVTISSNEESKTEGSRLAGNVYVVLTPCKKWLIRQNRDAPDIWELGDNDFETSRLC
jgi:hypothetical protein